MFRFYTPIFILQVFCIYHAYKTGRSQKWFYLIIFLPVIGSLIYLYDIFFTQRNLDDLSEGVKQVINTNHKIETLEEQLRLTNSQNNKMALADAYLEIGRTDDAIELYQKCLNANFPQTDVLLKLIEAHYSKKDYSSVVQYSNSLNNHPEFRNSEARLAYAWSLHYSDFHEKAQQEFEAMDVRFTNYKHRFEYAKYLIAIQNNATGKSKLEELIKEYQDMSGYEKRYKKDIYRAVNQLYTTTN